MNATRLTILACGLAASLAIGFHVAEPGADFNCFYSAAKLVGTGHLYDWNRMQEVASPHAATLLHYGRLPFYAFTTKWMPALPFGLAQLIWLLLSIGALIAFAALWPVEHRADLIAMLCWSCPAGILLAIGQDSALFLFCWTIGVLCLRSDRDFAAGLVLSLCAAKPHLALCIPVFLIARGKWTAIAGAIAGIILQLTVSFAVEGPGWPAAFLHALSLPDFVQSPEKMPNLHGLTSGLPYGPVLESLAGALVLAAVWFICRRAPLARAAAAAILGGLLVGHHAYVYDCVLMLPALALAREPGTPRLLRHWSLALVAPVPFVLLMMSRTAAVGQVLVTGYALVLLGWLAARSMGWRLNRTIGEVVNASITPGRLQQE
jgi:hypothetical protein